jgi:hypothetical protein
MGWAQRPVWTAVENLAPTGIRSPDRPALSKSLYRLSYRGPLPRSLDILHRFQAIFKDSITK